MKWILVLLSYSTLVVVKGVSQVDKLIVVSFDGFRYDFLDRKLTPNLLKIKAEGSSSRFVVNVFPTQTFPNHFSIATGLYSEVHGVLGPKVFDPKTKKVLDYGYELWHYNEDITPIWVFNQQSHPSRHSGVMMWPGSNFLYNKVSATFSVPFKEGAPWKKKVDEMISWFFDKKTPINFAMIYFEEPDLQSHIYGPDSPETNKKIALVDNICGYIMREVAARGLLDVNVIFLSDHGMEGVIKERIIDLYSVVSKDDCDIYGKSPVLQIYPKPGKEEEVYKKLKSHSLVNQNYNIYKKNDIPVHLHYKNCERAPPILALADPPFAFQDLFESIDWAVKKYNVSSSGSFGVHGYDPRTIKMHPYFIAYGPKFKDSFKTEQIYTVDLFMLFAHVLGLQLDSVPTNGSFSRVAALLADDPQTADIPIALMVVLVMAIFCSIYIYWRFNCKYYAYYKTVPYNSFVLEA